MRFCVLIHDVADLRWKPPVSCAVDHDMRNSQFAGL
jgi:hypothetical protein